MFRANQIITATQLQKRWPWFARLLDETPQALLITQKSGSKFVLVNAEVFEALLEAKMEKDTEESKLKYAAVSEL